MTKEEREELELAQLRLAVGSLLDIVAELAAGSEAGLRAERAWVDLVCKTVRQQKLALGFFV